MLRIRLQRKGRRKRPIWHIVIAEQHEARDGRIVERVGYYDNVTEKKEVTINEDRIFYWLDTGAQPTDTVRKILRQEGVLYKRHLMNWGKSEEEIEKALAEWKEYKDSKKGDATSRKADYKEVLAAEEREYKEQLQKKAKKAAAEVEAEKATSEEEAKDDGAPKSDADKIEDALEKAKDTSEKPKEEAPAKEESTEETPAADEAKAEKVEAKEADSKEEKAEEVADEAKDEPEAKVEATEEAPAAEEAKDEAPVEVEKEAEAGEAKKDEEKASGQVSTDMTAKDAIDHINDTDLADLKGFVPEAEDRVTVQRAWESKQEG